MRGNSILFGKGFFRMDDGLSISYKTTLFKKCVPQNIS